MILLMAINVWTVNQRLTRQFETEAAHNLATADAVFRNSLKIHRGDLLARFRNLPTDTHSSDQRHSGRPVRRCSPVYLRKRRTPRERQARSTHSAWGFRNEQCHGGKTSPAGGGNGGHHRGG
jgi:hypothetical protein